MLILVHNIHGYGGSFTRGCNLGKQLVARGHEVTLVAVSRNSSFRSTVSREPGMTIVQTPAAWGGHYQGGGWGVFDTAARLWSLAPRRFDLVYAFEHRPSVALPAYYFKYLRNIPLLADWGDLWCDGGHLDAAKNFPLQYGIERVLEKHIKRVSAGVTTVSGALWKRACELGIDEKRILHLPSGADTEGIRPLPKIQMREIHKIPPEWELVGYMSANIVDVEILLLGMKTVFSTRPACRLLFIGTDTGWHRDLAAHLGINDRIIWTGFRPYRELQELMACCDIMALPRSNVPINLFGVPAKIYDYLAAGRATVACEVGDMGRLFTEDAVGVLAKPDENEFASKVIFLLGHPRKAEELGARARVVAEKKYSRAIMAERFCSFLRRLPETRGLGL